MHRNIYEEIYEGMERLKQQHEETKASENKELVWDDVMKKWKPLVKDLGDCY